MRPPFIGSFEPERHTADGSQLELAAVMAGPLGLTPLEYRHRGARPGSFEMQGHWPSGGVRCRTVQMLQTRGLFSIHTRIAYHRG